MENQRKVEPSRRIPERIFAVGEEPVGVRVTPYQKPFALSNILRALEEDEVKVLRRSQFGKLVEIAEKPTFSGRFGRYIISRQLKVRKKHEAWFLFAGKPIRFSLREFAILTGMNCGKYPARSRKKGKRDINEKPYWGELFGTLKEVPVHSVLKMLKKRDVTAKDTRIKYAYLALLASVVLPTTHTPRISHEHAEKIKDLEAFLAFPWGRLSFELLISSIKERNEVSLSQNTIALKGFVLALQLLMIEAVPALTEAVHDGGSSGSEDDFVDAEERTGEERKGNRSISPGHARETDCSGKVNVVSIISAGNHEFDGEGQCGWSDDEEDDGVDYLLNLIDNGFSFNHAFFTGGASKIDVVRMREVTRSEAEIRRTAKQKSNQISGDVLGAESIAVSVKARLADDFSRVSEQLNRVSTHLSGIATEMKLVGAAFSNFQTAYLSTIQHKLTDGGLVTDVLQGGDEQTEDKDRHVNDVCTQPAPVIHGGVENTKFIESSLSLADDTGHPVSNVAAFTQTMPDVAGSPAVEQSSLDPGLLFPKPTFSLGLTQESPTKKNIETQVLSQESANIYVNKAVGVIIEDGGPSSVAFTKSKRQRVLSNALVGEYACDQNFLAIASETQLSAKHTGDNEGVAAKYSKLKAMLNTPFSFFVNGVKIESTELSLLLEKASHLPPKVVDLLMQHTRSIYNFTSPPITTNQAVFFDTRFVSQLGKTYGSFLKVVKKESFRFPDSLWDIFNACCPTIDAVSRFYFPFNLDKTHWVGVCIDSQSWQVQVLDCSISIRTDIKMYKEMRSIAVMFPFILRQAGKQIPAKELRPLVIDRPRLVPQIRKQFYSAVTAVLLIQAHAFGGLEVCKCITTNVVESEIERMAVSIVERNHGII